MHMDRNWPAVVRSALAVLLVIVSPSALAAIFVSVPGIAGSATDQDHRGWISSESLSWGIQDSATGPVFETAALVMPSGVWATGLATLAAQRRAVGPVVIDVAAAVGGRRIVVTRMTLRNVIVRSIKMTQAGDNVPAMLQVSLGFDEIHWIETAYDSAGSPVGNTEFRSKVLATK